MVKSRRGKDGPLAEARMSSHMLQSEMAEVIGCSTPVIVRLEKDPDKITVERLRKWYHAVPADGKAILEKYVTDAIFCA